MLANDSFQYVCLSWNHEILGTTRPSLANSWLSCFWNAQGFLGMIGGMAPEFMNIKMKQQ